MIDVYVENVTVPAHRARGLDGAAVDRLAESMAAMGLRTPISVRMDGDDLLLVAGAHRLEAARRLGWEKIPAVYIEGDERDARLWELAENLHRAELLPVERAEHIAEWVRLTAEKVSQLGTPAGGVQPQEAGIRKASRELGISKNAAHRATKIASLPSDIREQARAEAWSQKRLLEAARPTPVAPEPLDEDEAVEAQVKRLMAAWNAAGPDARGIFLERVQA